MWRHALHTSAATQTGDQAPKCSLFRIQGSGFLLPTSPVLIDCTWKQLESIICDAVTLTQSGRGAALDHSYTCYLLDNKWCLKIRFNQMERATNFCWSTACIVSYSTNTRNRWVVSTRRGFVWHVWLLWRQAIICGYEGVCGRIARVAASCPAGREYGKGYDLDGAAKQ